MKREVLIVDDREDMRWLLSNILKDEGYEATAVGNGKEALDYMEQSIPGVVLLDLKLPDLDGMEVLQRIRTLNQFTPVIVITAYGEIKSAVQAMKLGAYDYITKPFRNEGILLTINRALRDRDLRIEKAKLEQELRDMQEQLFRSEKLAALGRLSAGAAHEIFNPLSVISVRAQLLLANPDIDSSISRELKVIESQVKRITKIVRNLLSFSRGSPVEKTTLDLNLLVEKTLSLVEHERNFDNLEIITELDSNLPPILADGSQLAQVFVNLIINAMDAMNHGGNLTISTRRSIEKGFVEIVFKDTGCGIPEENLQKIFDPFFTTKEVGRGTGLGLSIVYGIIKNHGGTINVESEEGKGSTFTIILPIGECKQEKND